MPRSDTEYQPWNFREFFVLPWIQMPGEVHDFTRPSKRRRKGSRLGSAMTEGHDFGFDALIMLGPHTAKPLLTGKVPIAVVGWYVDDPAVDVVRTSDEHGMAQAVNHLVGLGHRHIAHIDGGTTVIAAARREGYEKAMHDHALGAYIRVVPGGQSQLDGQRAVRALLSAGDLPTALLAYNDDTAVAAMGLLAQRDIQVPGQLSIVGWDDGEVARTVASRVDDCCPGSDGDGPTRRGAHRGPDRRAPGRRP
jgi:hypothetical protein